MRAPPIPVPWKSRFRPRVVHASGGLLALRRGVSAVPKRQVDHEAHQPGAGQGDLHHQPPGADQEVVVEPEVRLNSSRAELALALAWDDSIWTHGRFMEELPFTWCRRRPSQPTCATHARIGYRTEYVQICRFGASHEDDDVYHPSKSTLTTPLHGLMIFARGKVVPARGNGCRRDLRKHLVDSTTAIFRD